MVDLRFKSDAGVLFYKLGQNQRQHRLRACLRDADGKASLTLRAYLVEFRKQFVFTLQHFLNVGIETLTGISEMKMGFAFKQTNAVF